MSTTTKRTICVYASSSEVLDRLYFDAAAALGRLIAQRGDTLIYGGGRVGLMGELARAVQAGGGHVVGVIPEKLLPQGYPQADETVVTPDMRQRKAIMESRADAFVVLPGGFGTLEEMLEVLTLKQLDFHQKPIILLNTAGFYDPLVTLFEHFYAQAFVRADYRALYHVAPDAGDAYAYLDAYRPPDLPAKWLNERA